MKLVASDMLREIAAEASTAFNNGSRALPLFSARYPAFALDDAYRVAALAHTMRLAEGTSLSAARPVHQ
ncbi:MAG TPA: hypothetical protein VI137_01650 [Pseudolabrys sp.]|jgi:hypothetical protein